MNFIKNVTNVAEQVTSTVKEMAVEIIDNEREIASTAAKEKLQKNHSAIKEQHALSNPTDRAHPFGVGVGVAKDVAGRPPLLNHPAAVSNGGAGNTVVVEKVMQHAPPALHQQQHLHRRDGGDNNNTRTHVSQNNMPSIQTQQTTNTNTWKELLHSKDAMIMDLQQKCRRVHIAEAEVNKFKRELERHEGLLRVKEEEIKALLAHKENNSDVMKNEEEQERASNRMVLLEEANEKLKSQLAEKEKDITAVEGLLHQERSKLEKMKIESMSAIKSDVQQALLEQTIESLKKENATLASENATLASKAEQIEKDKERLKTHLLEKEADEEDQFTHYAAMEEELQSLRLSAQSHPELERELQMAEQRASHLQDALDGKTYEIMNLQSALGQLTADSEMCSKQRMDIQKLQVRIQTLLQEKEALQAHRKEAEGTQNRMKEQQDELKSTVHRYKQENIEFKQENLKLRSALQECLDRIKGSDSDKDTLIDRRIVSKLLVTYFERGCAQEILEVMSGILGFTQEEKQKVYALSRGKGVLGKVANVPMAIVKAPLSMAGNAINETKVPETDSSLGELWIQFLTDSGADDEKAPP